MCHIPTVFERAVLDLVKSWCVKAEPDDFKRLVEKLQKTCDAKELRRVQGACAYLAHKLSK